MSEKIVGTNQFGKPLNYEAFIKRVESIHGVGKYDFSDTVYTGLNCRLNIRCVKHDHTYETSVKMLIHKDCVDTCDYCAEEKMGRKKQLTTKDFVEKAVEIHGDKYDYSEVEYVNASSKVKILCKKHRDYFWQTPNSHLGGRGCKKCGVEKRAKKKTVSNEDYIKKLKSIFDDRLDLSNFEYNSKKSTFTARCVKHNLVFSQLISSGKKGLSGCPDCKKENKIASTQKRAFNNFQVYKDKCRKLHNDRYDYSYAEHFYISDPVTILCRKHNEFFKQMMQNHARGFSGCSECYKEKTRNLYAYTNEEYKAIVEEKHGEGVFDLSMTEYTSSHEKVEARCIKHNRFFEIQANSFKRGCNACIDCKREAMTNFYDLEYLSDSDKKLDAILYHVRFKKPDNKTFDKIGVTKNSIEKRFRPIYLEEANLEISIVNILYTNLEDAINKEAEIIAKLDSEDLRYKIHYLKDYKNIAGWTECFPSGSTDLSYIFE